MLRNTSCPVCSTTGGSFPAVRQEAHQRGLNMSLLTPVTKSESYWTPGMKHNPTDSCFPFKNFPPMISAAECDWWGYHGTLSRFVLLSWSIQNSSSVLKVTIYQSNTYEDLKVGLPGTQCDLCPPQCKEREGKDYKRVKCILCLNNPDC